MARRVVRGIVCSLTGYDVVRIAVGALLLTAAGLKTHELVTEPVPGTGLLDSRWLLTLTVEFELLLGLCLLANIWPKPTWAVALACFGLFTCISLYKAFSGHASCGCFGRAPVNPWYTGTLDLVVVCSLVRCRPKESLFTMRHAIAASAIWLAIGLSVAYAMGTHRPTTLAKNGIIPGDGNLVILEPENWVGSRFPLLSYIEDFPQMIGPGKPPLRERLANGDWYLVLSRRGCPRCEKLLTQLHKRTEQNTVPAVAGTLLAVVETSSLASRIHPNGFESGRLAGGYRWFHRSPIAVHLRDGIVKSGMAVEDGSDGETESSLLPGFRTSTASLHGRSQDAHRAGFDGI